MTIYATPNSSLLRAKQSVEICQKARYAAALLVVIASLCQPLLNASADNLASLLIVAAISILTFQIALRADMIRSAPLPTFVVLSFNFATMSGALLAQTISFRPLAFNLQVPIFTFGGCALFQLSLIITLLLFVRGRAFRASARRINQHLVAPLGIMRRPTTLQLWLMGFLGCAVLVWTTDVSQAGGSEYGDIGSKFILGLMFLAYAPFLIPLLPFLFPTADRGKSGNFWPVLFYTILLVVIGIARNSRSTFSLGVATLGMVALLWMLMGQLPVTTKTKRTLAILSIASLLLVSTLSDLATAMILVRSERGAITASELVSKTISAIQDKTAIAQYRQITGERVDYNETYISNPFLNRFIQTKFFDNTLALDQIRSGAHANELWAITVDKILANLPTPILKVLGVEVDKLNLGFSMGDALYAAQTGVGLGGFRTGSTLGHGLALMGGFVYIAIIPIFLIAFILLQALSTTTNGFITISPVILLQLMRVYSLGCGDSLLNVISLIVRGLAQDVVLFAIVFWAVRFIDRTLFSRQRPAYVGLRR